MARSGSRATRTLPIPERLRASCRGSAERTAWLDSLPAVVGELERRWSIWIEPPFDGLEVSASWVAPARRADGSRAVLKVAMPHMEADHEIEGLRFWDGDPTVRLLEADDDRVAMLIEECRPGTTLRVLPEEGQDVIVAGLLRRLWRVPGTPHPFRPLSEMIDLWVDETNAKEEWWPDPVLVREGLAMFHELIAEPAADEALLATDLHAGNVLRAEREPWLVIDPKPFVGDRAYDATQHLLNRRDRVFDAATATIARFADLLEVDADRVRRWLFARAAAEHRDDWDDSWMRLALALRP
jgi:streptomycin 6-kinase